MNFEITDKIAILRHDDGKANVVGHNFIDATNDALDKSERDANALVITGRPGMLSGGFDLGEFKKGPEASQALVNNGARMFLRIFTHPQPVIVACSGHAIAAGIFLLLSADTRIGASGDYKLGLNETAIGMALPVFALELAKARLSKRYQTIAPIQARIFNPQSALDAGILDEVVSSDTLMDTAMEHAQLLGSYPSAAYAANKMGMRGAVADTIRKSLE